MRSLHRSVLLLCLLLPPLWAQAGVKDKLPPSWFPADQEKARQVFPSEILLYLDFEQDYNLWIKQHKDMDKLGDFAPGKGKVFILPYVLIPASEMSFGYISRHAKAKTLRHLLMDIGGQPHVRYFFHPYSPNGFSAYRDLIQRYGIHTEYLAITSASPRSLAVMNSEHPEWGPLWVKPSLHVEIDGSMRTQNKQKSRRAVLVSELYEEVDQKEQQSRNFAFMPEVATFLPAHMNLTTIIREIPEEMYAPNDHRIWLPAFSLAGSGDKEDTPLYWMVKRKNFLKNHGDASPLQALEGLTALGSDLKLPGLHGLFIGELFDSKESLVSFFRESLFRPFLRAYAYLALVEGLQGELHTQNYLYQINADTGMPTGRIMIKDMDGHRVDMELRQRFGRGFGSIRGIDEPYEYAKYTSAIGKGTDDNGKREPAFLGEYYLHHIRSIGGFNTIAQITDNVCRRFFALQKLVGQCKVEYEIDKVLAEEINNVLHSQGIAVTVEPGMLSQVGYTDSSRTRERGLNGLTQVLREGFDLKAAQSKEVIESNHPQRAIFDRQALYLLSHRRNSALQSSLEGSGKNQGKVLENIVYLFDKRRGLLEARKRNEETSRLTFFSLLEPELSRNSREFSQALQQGVWPEPGNQPAFKGFTESMSSFSFAVEHSLPFGQMTLPENNAIAASY